jgi:ADP-heptose:LPS heptosyltransferase
LKILVYRIGQLGDTMMSLPALWALKSHFTDASFTLLCDHHPGQNYVSAAELLQPTGIFDRVEFYKIDHSRTGRYLQPLRMLWLLARLRNRNYDTMAYLAPSARSSAQIGRDRKFFKAAGIRRFLAMDSFPIPPCKTPGQHLGTMASEADLLLARLGGDGIPVPEPGCGRLDLCLGPREENAVEEWLAKQPKAVARNWLGVGPGSKMSAKRWPLERFGEVIEHLIKRFDVWPVVFGDASDQHRGVELVSRWGCGYNAAGTLGARAAAAALRRCSLLLTNDTGTMHLAVAAGTPCVAIFSSRDYPGKWYPYGRGHRVFRTRIDCEGCALVECVERQSECLRQITSDTVVAGCVEILSRQNSPAAALSNQAR